MGSIRPSYEWRARNAEQKRASIDDAERAVLAAAKAWNLALGTPAALDATQELLFTTNALLALEAKGGAS